VVTLRVIKNINIMKRWDIRRAIPDEVVERDGVLKGVQPNPAGGGISM
jgi:hypothetical protein